MEAASSRTGRVVIDEDGDVSVVGAGRVYKDKHTPLLALERVLAAADLTSFGEAIRNPNRYHAEVPARIRIVLSEDENFDPYLCDADDVSLFVDEAGVFGCFEVVVKVGRRLAESGYHRLLEAPLAALGCRVDHFEFRYWDGSTEENYADLDLFGNAVEPPEGGYLSVYVRGETIAELIAGARLGRALVVAAGDRPMDAVAAANLVRAGMVEAVIGLRESEWLEVKGRPYRLSAPEGQAARHKFELAQDVARFANGDVDGVLLVGYRTDAADADVEVVADLSPVRLSDSSPEQHRKVIDARVYPAVEGLRVDQVALSDDSAVLVIEIPRQPEFLKPFLVHGAVIDGRVDGSFISIVRRRGSHSIVTDPSQLHSQLAVGRAVRHLGDRNTADDSSDCRPPM